MSLSGALRRSGLSVGFTLGSVLPIARTAQAVSMALFFPMLFLSGASGMPRELRPETLRRISDLLPLSYVVTLLTDRWYGQGWNSGALLALIGLPIVGSAGATLAFRWEQRAGAPIEGMAGAGAAQSSDRLKERRNTVCALLKLLPYTKPCRRTGMVAQSG